MKECFYCFVFLKGGQFKERNGQMKEGVEDRGRRDGVKDGVSVTWLW